MVGLHERVERPICCKVPFHEFVELLVGLAALVGESPQFGVLGCSPRSETVVTNLQHHTEGRKASRHECQKQRRDGLSRRRHDQTLPASGSAVRDVKPDRKSTRLNSSHTSISYSLFFFKKNQSAHTTLSLTTECVARRRTVS